MHIKIKCGSSETEVKEFAVKPIGLESLSRVVTTVTPDYWFIMIATRTSTRSRPSIHHVI